MGVKRCLKIYSVLSLLTLICVSCGVDLPKDAHDRDSLEVVLYPDYKDVAIPCNIAPLNFIVQTPNEECRVCVTSPFSEQLIVKSDENGKVVFPMQSWKSMLAANKDTILEVDVYVKNGEWSRLKPFYWFVKSDSIDPYMTCRLIEPSYRGHADLNIIMFDLEHNREHVVASNKKVRPEPFPLDGNSCLNCHSQQRNGSGNGSFCFRGKNGGLVVTYNGKTKIVNTKVGDMYTSTMYESWHPFLPYIAFSINEVGQSFPAVESSSKAEIIDSRSDIVLYDIEKDEISYIQKTPNRMETFPCWSHDGKFLYFAATDSSLQHPTRYKQLKYDIYRISFDSDSLKWGTAERVVDMSSKGLSANYPQPSPDGRFLLYAVSLYGSSPYRHADCDVYSLDLATGLSSPVTPLNDGKASDYCRGWSSNGKWVLISSRREDGNYARSYFSYCGAEGKFCKPFQMPHEDPIYDKELLKSYNCSQFASVVSPLTPSDFYRLLDTSIVKCSNYRGALDMPVDANSGASVIR